jgi:hypothetical protein
MSSGPDVECERALGNFKPAFRVVAYQIDVFFGACQIIAQANRIRIEVDEVPAAVGFQGRTLERPISLRLNVVPIVGC